MKGLSGVSSDMLELEASDAPRAREAIDYFAHRIRMEIGALAATLKGLDALVFTGGIGEHSARVRAAVLGDMRWLGLTLDAAANNSNARRIMRSGRGDAGVRAGDRRRSDDRLSHDQDGGT